MVTLNKPSAGDTNWTSSVNNNWTNIENEVNLLKKYIEGLQVDVTSATVVSVAAGRCRDKDDTFDIVLSASDTADITVSTDRDFTEAASTWYYVWVIADSNGVNATRAFLSSSSTAPTLPSGYNKARRVGAVRNDASSNFPQGVTRGKGPTRLFWYVAAVQVLSSSDQTTWQTLSLASVVPPTSQLAFFQAEYTTNADTGVNFRRPGDTSDSIAALRVWAPAKRAVNTFDIPTDSSQQIQWRSDNAVSSTIYGTVMGYYDDL